MSSSNILISPTSLKKNVEQLQSLISKETILAPCIKANAYGHGLLLIVEQLTKLGIDWLCIQNLEEARQLREAGIDANLLFIGPFLPAQADKIVELNLKPFISTQAQYEALHHAARNQQIPIAVHLKVDTGMSRQGFLPDEAIHHLKEIKTNYRFIRPEGLATHFATADERKMSSRKDEKELQFLSGIPSNHTKDNLETTDVSHYNNNPILPGESGQSESTENTEQTGSLYLHQKKVFLQLIKQLDSLHLKPPIVHAANSAAALSDPDVHFNLIRPGLAIYGYSPFLPLSSRPKQSEVERSNEATVKINFSQSSYHTSQFTPILSWHTQLVQIKTIPAESYISYGATAQVNQETKIGIIPVGYADGLDRRLSNKAEVLINRSRAPILGRISMNLTIVDLTHIPEPKVGDTVTLIGTQGQESISAHDHAIWAQTIPYEILSRLNPGIPHSLMG